MPRTTNPELTAAREDSKGRNFSEVPHRVIHHCRKDQKRSRKGCELSCNKPLLCITSPCFLRAVVPETFEGFTDPYRYYIEWGDRKGNEASGHVSFSASAPHFYPWSFFPSLRELCIQQVRLCRKVWWGGRKAVASLASWQGERCIHGNV